MSASGARAWRAFPRRIQGERVRVERMARLPEEDPVRDRAGFRTGSSSGSVQGECRASANAAQSVVWSAFAEASGRCASGAGPLRASDAGA